MSASKNFNPNYVVPANHNRFDPAPSTLTSDGYAKVQELSAEGNCWDAIAGFLGISASTLRAMRKEDPAITDAYLLGKSKLDTEVTTKLVTKMREGDLTATIFLAKTKLGFREVGPTSDTPQTAIQTNIYVTAPMTDEQFARLTSPTPPNKEPTE